MRGTNIPQDYIEEITAEGRIHGTTQFEEPQDERQRQLLDQAIRMGHHCRYCDMPVPLGTTVCSEHLSEYQQNCKKAKAQAQRLCEIARERTMVTHVRTRLANTVTI